VECLQKEGGEKRRKGMKSGGKRGFCHSERGEELLRKKTLSKRNKNLSQRGEMEKSNALQGGVTGKNPRNTKRTLTQEREKDSRRHSLREYSESQGKTGG